MHWQDAVKSSNIGRAVRSYDRDRKIIRVCNGDCYLCYSDTGKFIRELEDKHGIEGLLDWLPMHIPVEKMRWFDKLLRWFIKRR